jgi:tetratricopeptide (TPR) repeat protein
MPIQRVLKGEITLLENAFKIRLMLVQYPDGKVTALGENRFNMYNVNQFMNWIREQSHHLFPMNASGNPESFPAPDSLLTMLKIQFYKQDYAQCLKTLTFARDRDNGHPEVDIWKQYIDIRIAGLDSQENPITNPFEKKIPEWQKKMQIARNRLLDYLRLGKTEKRMDLMIAESYLWEKDFASAEIFLKKEFVENPFNIDVLANLAYLHPSRYREFQFNDAMEIRRRILELCPIEEDVLIKWSDLILLGNPAYTAPPKKAQERVEKYLTINPHSYRGWLMHGKILAHALKRKQALESYFKADSLAPKNGLVQYNIGIVYYELKNLPLAEDYMKKAIDYQNYLNAYLYLGTILKEQGKYEEALEKFRYRVKHKTSDDDYYAQQAMKGIQECLAALGQNP